jgi:hypothetical protein
MGIMLSRCLGLFLMRRFPVDQPPLLAHGNQIIAAVSSSVALLLLCDQLASRHLDADDQRRAPYLGDGHGGFVKA